MRTDCRNQPLDDARHTWHLTGAPVEICVDAGANDPSKAGRAEAIVRGEVSRALRVFNIDDGASMLSRWVDDPSIATSNEFEHVLSTALRWQRSSRGAFNVSTRRLRKLWEQAAADGCQPSPGELHELAIDIAQPPYRFDGHVLRQLRNCDELDLNAIASGFAIDTACEAARRRCDLRGLTVSASGTIVRQGFGDIEVRIDGLADRNDVAPTVALGNAAVALRVAGRRRAFGAGDHAPVRLFDPRTAQRPTGGVSVGVVAPDATTARAVATIVSVMAPTHGLDFVDRLNSPRRSRHPSEWSIDTYGSIQCWILDFRGVLRRTGPR